jgi:prepilin-type N-terminal cleavage/methylation domain-containing protein
MKGFTLVEILITIVILSFSVVGMFSLMNYARTNYDTNFVSLNLQQQARQGIIQLSREIRQAYWKSIWDPFPADPVVNTITEPDENENNSITFNTPNTDEINYSLIETEVSGKELWQLKRTCPTCTDNIIANDITGLLFSRGEHIVNITVTASKTFKSLNQERTLTFPLTEQVEVRNP